LTALNSPPDKVIETTPDYFAFITVEPQADEIVKQMKRAKFLICMPDVQAF